MVGCLVLLVESVDSLCSRGRIIVTVIVTVRILIYYLLLLATKAVILRILGYGLLVREDLRVIYLFRRLLPPALMLIPLFRAVLAVAKFVLRI